MKERLLNVIKAMKRIALVSIIFGLCTLNASCCCRDFRKGWRLGSADKMYPGPRLYHGGELALIQVYSFVENAEHEILVEWEKDLCKIDKVNGLSYEPSSLAFVFPGCHDFRFVNSILPPQSGFDESHIYYKHLCFKKGFYYVIHCRINIDDANATSVIIFKEEPQ